MTKQCILWLVTAAVFLVTSTAAVPLSDEYYQSDEPVRQCAVTCPESSGKFAYSIGKTYEYLYNSDLKTSIPGTSGTEHSSLHMKANVLLDVISQCEITLRLTDVSLQDSNPANYDTRQTIRDLATFKRKLQDYSMSFAFIDGRIESVCPQADDSTWAVNIRRGIVSSLQNTMNRLQGMTNVRETDVAGNCPVKYEVTSSSMQTVKVKKTKDLLACTDRLAAQTIFQGIDYDSTSDIKSMPLIMSTHSCEQEVNMKTKIITNIVCSENHAFRPFAKWNSGAVTEVSYKLTFRRVVDTNQRSAESPRRTRSTLLFDHTLSDQQADQAIRDIQQTFQAMCQKSEVDVRPELPGLFTKAVHQMRRLNTQNLRQLLTTVQPTCTKALKFYRDALPLLGTTASVTTMRQMISAGQITGREIDVWFSSLAFIKNPTREMIKELKPMLESYMGRAALPVSALINTYCQQNDNQQSNSDVNQIMKLFEDELKYNCRTDSDEQTSKMLTALRAIGNAGLAAQSIAGTLTRCAGNDATPMSVRVAAINAFRRIDCNANNRNELFAILENSQADSELRINAYLAVMQCANQATLQRVQTVLQSDEVNQVLSFIWTHLTNLRETASPLKRDIRAILENAELQKEFDMDKRKFSRNIELSTFSDLLNVGGSVESNLIWSGNSFVPRSASFNFTVDMFGQSINLFEVGGRIQGVEDLLEQLVGPNTDFDNTIGGKRERRAPIRDELFNRLDRTFAKAADSDQLSYYLRVFGNTIRAGDIFQFDLDSLKNRFNYFDWLIELAKDHNIDYSKSFHFLDADVTIPTGTGFPLKLTAEGSANIGMKVQGKIDIRQMFSSPSTFDVSGSVRPSAAIEVRASMGIDGQYASTGLKIVNTMHSSTVLDGVVRLQNGRVFNFDWNLPQDKIEIFNAESHIYVTYRDEDREQQAGSGETWSWKRCTNKDAANKIGLEMCGELTVPTMGNVLGPAIARVYVNKLDTYTGLHFDTSYVHSEEANTDSVRVSLNTPGSRDDHELTAEFSLKRQQREILLNVKTPWKKVRVEGGVVFTNDLKRASLKATVDETTEYSMTAELQKALNERLQTTRYSPKMTIVIPERPNVVLDGFINVAPKRYDVKLALKNAARDPITVEGFISTVEKRATIKYDVSMQIGAPNFKGSIMGYTSNSTDGSSKTWASRAVINYQYKAGTKEQIVINHKYRDQSISNLNTYSTDCSWTSTLWPRYNGQAGFELSFSSNSVRTRITAGLDDLRKVTITTSGAYDFVSRDKKLNGLVKFTLPYKDWDYEVKVDHAHNDDSLQSNATIKYGAGQQQNVATVDIGLKKEGERPLNVMGEVHIRYPGREISITETLNERAPREYSNVAVVQWQRGQQTRIVSTYKMVPRHEFTNDISVTGMQPIRFNGHLSPNPRNAQGRLEVTYDRKVYVIGGNWMLRESGITQFNVQAGAEFACGLRGLTLSTEISRRDQEVTGNMEAIYKTKTGQALKYTVNGQFTTAMTTPKFQIRVDWPSNNFVMLTGNGKYETRGWSSTTNDLEGNLQLTSSLSPIQFVAVKFVHDQSGNGHKTNGEVQWTENQKVTAELSVDKPKNKVTLTMVTPFNGYQTINAEGSYSVRGRSATATGKVQWDNRQMMLTVQGDANQPERAITGKITFNSPFNGFENLVGNLRYSLAGDRHNGNADFLWARGKQVAATITMSHSKNGMYITSNGELTVTTPWPKYRTNKLRWQHQNTAETWKCKHEIDFDGKKYGVEVDTNHQVTGNKRQIAGKVAFVFPVIADWLRNISLNVECEHDLQGIRSTGKTVLTYGRDVYSHEHDVNINNNALVTSAKIRTPFESIREIGLVLNNRLTNTGFTANNELIMGSKGKFGLDGSFTRNGYAVQGTATLTTPCPKMGRISTNVRTYQQAGVWIGHADVQYGQDKTVSLDGKWGGPIDNKIVELELRTPYEVIRQAKASSTMTGQTRNFQTTIGFTYTTAGNVKSFTYALAADTADLRNINAELTLGSPYEAFSSFKVTGRHRRDTDEHTLSTLTWELNKSQRGSANVDWNMRSVSDFNGKAEVEYVRGRKLELTTAFRLDPTMSATATFKSPFDSAKIITFSLNQNGPLDNFVTQAELVHNRNNRYTAGFNLTARDDTFRGAFRLTTPHSSIERLAIQMGLVGRPTSFNFDTSFELNNRRYAETINFQLTNDGQNMALSGRMETPYDVMRTVTYSINHQGPWRSFNNNIVFNLNGQESTANTQFKLDGPQNIAFELRTPYQPLTTITLTHTTKPGRTFAGWQNSAVVESNGRRYTGETEWGWKGKELKAKAVFNLPEEYSVYLTQKTDSPYNMDATCTLKMYRHQIKKTVSLKTEPNLIEFKHTTETTFRGYERWNVNFKHEGPADNFKTMASVETPLSVVPRVATELSYRKGQNEHSSTFKLDSPLPIRQVVATLNYRGPPEDMTSSFSLQLDDKTTTATMTYKRDQRNSQGTLNIRSPYDELTSFNCRYSVTGDSFKSFQASGSLAYESTVLPDLGSPTFSIDHSAPSPTQIRTVVQMTLPRGQVSGTFTHNGNAANFKTNVQATLPRAYTDGSSSRTSVTYQASIDHQTTSGTTPKTIFVIQLPGNSDKLTLSKIGTGTNLQLSAELLTSIRGLGRTAASWTHSVASNNVAAKATVETSINEWARTSVSLNHKGTINNFETTVELETSKQGYEKLTATLSNAVERTGVKTAAQITTTLPGMNKFSVNSEIIYRGRGVRWSATAETPIRGYDRWTASFEHAPNNNGFRTSISATSPIQGWSTFGVVLGHTGDASQFQSTLRITTPLRNAPQIDLTLTHRGTTAANFNTTLTAEFGSGKRIQTGLGFKVTPGRSETNYEGSAMLQTTVCPYFKDFAISASHNRKPDVKSGAMTVTCNGEQKVDFDYSYATTGNRNININIRNPRSISTQMNLAGNGEGSAAIGWDKTKQIQFDFAFKDVVTATNVDRLISFRTTVPHYRRTVGFGYGYTKAQDRISSRGDLYWDTDAEPDFSYETEVSKKLTSRREVIGYDGKFKVVSALFNTDSTFTHRILSNGRQHKTEIALQAAETLTIKSDLNLASGFSHKITIGHPRFSKDITLLTDATPSSFKTTLDYEQQTWTLEGSLVDESAANNGPKYSATLRLANPTNLIDVQLTGDCAIMPAEGTTNAGFAIKYLMSRDRQMKTLAALRTEINKLRKEIKIELDTPIDNLRLSTTNRELDIESGIVRYDVSAQCNHYNVRSTVDFSRPERSLNVKLYSTPDNYVEVFGQVISPTQMNFELSHVQNGDRTNDASLSLSYSPAERLMSGRSYFSPQLRNLAKSVVSGHSEAITASKNRLTSDINQFVSLMQADSRQKASKLRTAVAAPMMKVVSYINAELSAKADEINTAFARAYQANEFYMKDLHLALRRNFEDFSRRMAIRTAELNRKYNQWLEATRYHFNDVTEAFDDWNESVQSSLADWQAQVADQLEQMQPNFDQIQPYLENFFETVRITLTELFDHVRNAEKFNQFLDKLNSVEMNKYIVPPSQWRERLLAYADRVDKWLEQLLSRPEVHYVRNWLVKTLENNTWLYKLLGIEQQINERIAQLKTMTYEILKNKIQAFANEYLQLDKTKWTVWDPSRGEYAFQIFIPYELPDFSALKRFDPRPLISQAKNWVVKQLPSDDLSLVEKLYALKPSSNPRDWVPPFKSHASLIGTQHYMTFDRRFFEFAGECSYLLARDFIGGTFSVAVNYDRATVLNKAVKKSLTVVSGGRQIEVFPDGKITADGTRIEMPAVVGNSTVWRQGNVIRVMDDMRGVSVTCDLPHDHCTLAVSGWYYGKTAGLFGTYDNEPSNDFTSSDRTISPRPEVTAESWTLGSRCRPINRAHVVQPDPETRRYRACAELFEQRSSMFRSCFLRVDPKPFMTMCLNDAPVGDNSLEAEIDVCKAASAYVTECRNMEMPLRMPKKCVRCEVPTTSKVFYELDTIRLEEPSSIPRAADVVFVIQHARCNVDVLDKIAGLVDSMEKAMRSEELTSTRYAVVGFGGKKSHLSGAHVHTMDGQIFNSANKLALALDKFDFEGGDEHDAMLALSYTARLPFRAGASKTIILVGCDACTEGKVRYSDIQRIMLNNDIHLHVLVQDTIRLKSKSPKTAYIYGVDQSTVYTRKDVVGDELTGEPDLRRFIRLPKDLCVALTQDTDGSIFSVRQWLDSRPMIQKQFVDVMVRAIARKSQPTECQICECLADETQIGVSKCRSCFHRDPAIWLSPSYDEDDDSDVDSAGSQVSSVTSNKIGKSDINTADETTPAMTTLRTVRPRRPSRVTRKPVVRVTGRPRADSSAK